MIRNDGSSIHHKVDKWMCFFFSCLHRVVEPQQSIEIPVAIPCFEGRRQRAARFFAHTAAARAAKTFGRTFRNPISSVRSRARDARRDGLCVPWWEGAAGRGCDKHPHCSRVLLARPRAAAAIPVPNEGNPLRIPQQGSRVAPAN